MRVTVFMLRGIDQEDSLINL